MAKQKKPVHRVEMTEGKRNIIRQLIHDGGCTSPPVAANEEFRMEIVNDIYKKLHDLDYFLLRYGPKDVAKYVEDDSTVSKYYGTLPFY